MNKRRPTPTAAQLNDLQQRIDQGILLAQTRLVQTAQRMDYTLVVCRAGKLQELTAADFAL